MDPSNSHLSTYSESIPEVTNWDLFHAMQLAMLAVRTAPPFILPLLLQHIDPRHIFPSSRLSYNDTHIYNMPLLHDVCLDHKHEAIAIVLSKMGHRVASSESKRMDYIMLELDTNMKDYDEYEFLYTPLQTAWEPMICHEYHSKVLSSITCLDDLSQNINSDARNLWSTSVYILQALDEKDIESTLCLHRSSDWSILHAITRASPLIHTAVLWFALKLYPEHTATKDMTGNCPIHIVASKSIYYKSPLSSILCNHECCSITNEWDLSPIQLLLEADATVASIPDSNRRLPLHLILSNHSYAVDQLSQSERRHGDFISSKGFHINVEESVDALLQAYPPAIESKDPVTGLYPWMLAASVPTIPLDVIYKLIRRSPILVTISV